MEFERIKIPNVIKKKMKSKPWDKINLFEGKK